MNDEQKQNLTVSGSPENGRNEQGRNRRRRRRGGKKHGNRADGVANNQPQIDRNAAQSAPAEQQPSNGGKKHGKNRFRRRDRRHRADFKESGSAEQSSDSLSLEELRAKIVLQSADGTSPAESLTAEQKNPDNSENFAASADAEPFSAPVAEEDLLASPEVLIPPSIPKEERIEVIGVRFREAGKSYYFDPKGKPVRIGDFVVVETSRGPEFGEVAFGNRVISKKKISSALRPLLRVATSEDIAHNAENRTRETEAAAVFRKKAEEHQLEMKLIDVQFAFDNSKLLFYFTSEGRVDFRDLVKDLAGFFRTRIELRQVGIRDEAKLLGGLGACGRQLCCASFLPDFVQVSIKMAKEQGLSLNSAKISGACGRLMCCLRYETESYAKEISLTPPVGSTVKTPDGVGEVIANNPIAATVRVLLKDQDSPKQFSRDAVTVIGFQKRERAEKSET